MKVSVITPIHNSRSTLAQTIKSVVSQTEQDWELQLVDDASTDDSLALARQFAEQDSRISVHSLAQPVGAAKARNHAILQATGRFIAFLDSDDMWLPHKLERQIPYMISSHGALSYTAYHKVGAEFNGQAKDWRGEGRVVRAPESLSHAQLLKHDFIGCLTAVYDRELVGTVLMPEIAKRQDYALWLRILRSYDRAVGLNEPLALYRANRTGSLSSNKLKTLPYTWKVYRELESLSRLEAFRNVVSHGTRAALKMRI